MASKNIKHLDDSSFEEGTKSGVVLVDFFAEWCGPCKMLTPILDELADEMQGRMVVAKLDIDQAQRTTQQFDVTSVPTLVLFKNGQEIERVIGLKDKGSLQGMLEAAL